MKLTAKVIIPILAVSLTQIARALSPNSIASGNWSNPSSWDIGVPDTYASDIATINAGNVIDYDSGTTLAGGGLGIANGGSLTIDGAGAVLTQLVNTQAIRVGEGSGGAGTGAGTLTIQNGGAMNTGLALGLAVGSQIAGGVNGNGTLNVFGGTLTMGTGAAAGGLGVGLDGSTGVLNVGNGGATSTVDLRTNNILMAIGANQGNGTLTIDSTGVIDFGTNAIYVGQGAGSVGAMSNAGAIGTGGFATGEVRVGGGGGTGMFTMTAGTLTTTGEFNIGRDAGSAGTGTLSAGAATVGQFIVGRDSGTGTFTMTGGLLASSNQFVVGQSSGAANSATISAGTVTSVNETRVGEGTGAVGTLNISGSTNFTSGGELQVGNDAGTGTMNMSGGTVTINQWGAIGRNGGTGTLNFSGGTIQMAGGNRTFDIGVFGGNGNAFGTGTMNQTGGTLINTTNQTTIGRDASGVGFWNMSAGTATLTGQNLIVGNSGQGTLNITGGSITGVNQLNVAANGGSTGALNISSVGLNLTSREFYVGNGGGGVGTVNVNNGTLQTNEWVEVGRNGGTGTVNITGPNAKWERGTLAGGMAKDVQIGYQGGTGVLNVTGGGTFNTNWWLNLGRGGTSSGTALVDGAGSAIHITNNGRLNVGGGPNGDTGTGLLTISNGGTVTKSGDEWNVGDRATSVGTVTVQTGGSLISNDGDSFIGRDGGTGTLNISGAGSIVSTSAGGGGSQVHVGIGGASSGTVNIASGGKLTTNQGWFGVGQDSSTGVVTVDGAGSSLTARGIIVGWSGTGNGTINIQNNAVVTNANTPGGGPELSMGRDNATATGTINILSGGTLNAGRNFRIGANGFGTVNINAGTFIGSSGDWGIIGDGGTSNGVVNVTNGTFTHNDTLFLGANPGAHGTFTQSGTSTSLVTGELNIGRNGSIGALNVNGGTFQVNGWTTLGRDGNNGSGTINVTNGGTYNHQSGNNGDFLLGWTNGSTGTVNVNSGGTVNYSWWTRVAVDGGSTGAITVDGATSNWNNTGGRVFIGESGNGTLNITNGGKFTMTNADWFVAGGNDGANSKGHGIVTISGAGSSLTSNNFLAFGRGRVDGANLATGTLNMTSGTIASTGSWIGFGTDQGTGTANISGTAVGSSAAETITGRGVNSVGTFNLSGTAVWTSGGEFQVGNDGGTGVANISGGTLNLLSYMAIGRNTNGNGGLNGGNGTVNLSGTGVINKVNGNGTFDIGSWNGGNNATINTIGTLNQSAGTTINNTVSDTHLGRDTGTVGVWNMNGGTANLASLNVGNNGTGTLVMDGVGTVITAGGESRIGNGGGSTGTMTVRNGAAVHFNGGWSAKVGASGTGTMNIETGGQVTGNSWFVIAAENGSTGTVNVSGAASAITMGGDGRFMVGRAGNATLNQSGGAITVAGWSAVALDATSVGVYNMSGGSLTGTTGDDFIIGRQGNGTLNMSAGNISIPQRFLIASDGGSFGTANLTGGVITAHFFEIGGGTGTVNWSNDTLRANQNEGNFLRNFNAGNSEITGGASVIFNSNTFNITAQNQMDGAGGLTKIGNGTLALTAQNLYTGVTTLTGGNLNVGSAENAGVSGPLGTSAAANPGSIVFSGGTLQYSAANQNDYSGRFSTAVNQAYRVDTNSQNVTWATSLVSSGGSLTKFGNGTLFLPVANTYTAGTAIHGGTVNINGDAALGAATGGVMIDNNAIVQAASPVTSGRTITLGAGGGTIDTNGNNVTLTNTSMVTGIPGAALTHIGAGNLDIKGTQTYDILNANGGITTLDSALKDSAGGNTATLNANATTQINVSQNLGALNIGNGTEVTFGDGLPFAPEPPKPLASFGGHAASSVPEPGSLGLLLVGALGLMARRRRSC